MEPYLHKVQYYETDKMGITHHSNYIRWMEEARVDYMDQLGYGYARMESLGLISPVIGVHCQYKETTTFDDMVSIVTRIKEFRGVRLVIEYQMTKQDGAVVLTGTTEHCFLTQQGHPARLNKVCPELYERLIRSISESNKE